MRPRCLIFAALLAVAGCSSGSTPAAPEDAAPVEELGAVELVDEDTSETESADGLPDGVAFEASDSSDNNGGAKTIVSPSDEEAAVSSEPNESVEANQTGDDSSATDSGTPDAQQSASTPSGSDPRIDELIDFVEAERGYAFTQRPSIELLDNDEFNDAWVEVVIDDVAENRDDYTNFTDIYRAMGIIDDDRSLEDMWLQFGDAGVLGFYEPSSGDIVLRAGEFTTFTETVLVHELVHALEDQIFDLDRPEYADRDDEVAWTFSALIEGSARRIESAYRQTFTQAELDEENAARQAIPRSVSLAEFTPSFLELQFGRYRYGLDFVDAVWAEGPATLDEALTNPPSTSEAIFDPAGYLDGSIDPESISPPPADGEVFESGTWGQAGWTALFTDVVSRAEAEAAADGWDGDSYVAWRSGSVTCVRAHLAADTPDQLDDYADILEQWAAISSSRDVFYPTADLIRVTSCG